MLSGELPSSMWLDGVKFDRVNQIGWGGEVHVYTGKFKGQTIVVREVPQDPEFWKSSAGQDTIKVSVLFHDIILC